MLDTIGSLARSLSNSDCSAADSADKEALVTSDSFSKDSVACSIAASLRSSFDATDVPVANVSVTLCAETVTDPPLRNTLAATATDATPTVNFLIA